MILPLPLPTKEVDVDFLVFVQRYATDLLRWDILAFFAHHPDARATISQVAQHIGRSPHSIQPEIGDLEMLRILEQTQGPDDETSYQLTTDPHLRRMTLKFANQLIPHVTTYNGSAAAPS